MLELNLNNNCSGEGDFLITNKYVNMNLVLDVTSIRTSLDLKLLNVNHMDSNEMELINPLAYPVSLVL